MTDDGVLDRHLDELRQLYAAEASEALVNHVRDLWERFGDATAPSLGECFRLAMLGATKMGRLGEAAAWRARARSNFARSGCRNGTAMLMLPDFFVTVREFQTEPEHALAILDAMEATIGGSDHPVSAAMVRGSYLEKRGYLRTKLGTATADSGLLRHAHDDYEEALAWTTDLRRSLKIRAAMTSVQFHLAETSDDSRAAVDALAAIVEEADATGDEAIDVVRIGRTNMQRMSAGDTDLQPYEVL